MKKLAEWLCSFSSDKYVHYIVCLIGTLVMSKIIVLLCHCPAYKGAATTAILNAVAGDTATLVSDGTNWIMTQ